MKIVKLLNCYIVKLKVRDEDSKVRNYQKAETLVEVLVALGIIAVTATALASVVVTSVSNARFGRNQNLATQYAQEGMEILRQKRDSDYASFRSIATGSYCLAGGSIILEPDCMTANVDNFLRKVDITQSGCSADVANITVRVSWQDGKCAMGNPFCHTVRLESCLSTVNPVAPL